MTITKKKMVGIGVGSMLMMFVLGATNIMTNNPSTSKEMMDNKSTTIKIPLTKLYDNKNSKYSIKYPAEWVYDDSEKGAVIFSGKKATPEYYSTINIQTVLGKKAGGGYASVNDVLTDVKKQILKESPKTNFLKTGPFILTLADGSKLNGEYLIFIYSYQGNIIEQWQIVVPRDGEKVFYTWAYTAPIQLFNGNLNIAKSMLATWNIY